jgi:hypothetical protein
MVLVESAVYQLELADLSVPAGFKIACPREATFNGVKDKRNGLFSPDPVGHPIRPVKDPFKKGE